MAVLPIVEGASTKVLRTKTKPVEKVTKELKKLLKDMKETMDHAKGVGLAAPQVGVGLRVCVAVIDGKAVSLINPHIISQSEQTALDEEGCLSLPTTWLPVPRSVEIVVSYKDEKGKQQEKKLADFNARVVQHEVDHLDGKLIVDYAPLPFTMPPSMPKTVTGL
jgi:peptide deformylase